MNAKGSPDFFGDDKTTRLVDPWSEVKPNSKNHTGGDWYNMLLCASLGFKSVHGANTSPTMEVLCKSSKLDLDDGSVGLVKWEPKSQVGESLGPDPSDSMYAYHQYRGTVTTSGNILAYEAGTWEPSIRSRARASSLLAAGLHAHGCPKKDAIKAVSIIASDHIDEEAVEGTLVPTSHLKREMTIVSKANHRIFSRGTYQSGILWHDSHLMVRREEQTVAFDWGRVTTIARYIAEANLQVCPLFRHLASTTGVPYYIVRNAWAYVSTTDYHITPQQLSIVPKVDIGKFKIPSIKGAFSNHEQDVLLALTRAVETHSRTTNIDMFQAYLKIYKRAKKKTKRVKKLRKPDIMTAQEVTYTQHTYTGESTLAAFATTSVVWSAYLEAIKQRIRADASIARVLETYKQAIQSGNTCKEVEMLDRLTQFILAKRTWMLARALANAAVNAKRRETPKCSEISDVEVSMELSRLKQSVFGFPTHLDADVHLPTSLCVATRQFTKNALIDAERMVTTIQVSQKLLANQDVLDAAEAYASMATKAEAIIPTIRSDASLTFKEWSKIAFTHDDSIVQIRGVSFYFAAYALKHLDVRQCLSQSSGFIDGATPERTYIYQGMKKYSKETGTDHPKLKRLVYTSASQIAIELDERRILPYSMVEVVEFVTSVLEETVGCLMVDKIYVPSQTIIQELYEGIELPDSPRYDDASLKEEEYMTILRAINEEMQEKYDARMTDKYSTILNTYPNASVAEEYAKVMGYSSFREVVDLLGYDCAYLDTNLYIARASGKIAHAAAAQSTPKSKTPVNYSVII